MKHFYLILPVFLLLNACNTLKSPEFQGIESIKLKNDNGQPVLVAYAKYHNPNLVGGQFKISEVKVFVNDKFLANLNSDTYQVPSKKDFIIPLEVNLDQNYFKKNNILEALNTAINNKLEVHYQGKIYYVSYGLKVPYKIDHTQNIKIFD